MTVRSGQNLTETFLDKAQPPLFHAGDFRVGDLLFNQWEGLGGTVVNQTWPLSSFVAFMKPEIFLALACPGVVHNSAGFILDGLRRYAGTGSFPLASPYLMADFSGASPRVSSHEGRNRMRAIRALGGADDVPVLIHPVGAKPLERLDAHDISNFFAGATGESGAKVGGPLFSRVLLGNRLFTPLAP